MTRSSSLFVCLIVLFWVIGFRPTVAGAGGGLYMAGVCVIISAHGACGRVGTASCGDLGQHGSNISTTPIWSAWCAPSPHAPICRRPEVYTIDEPQCHALAVGHTPSQSVLVLTTGALRKFTVPNWHQSSATS
jgi:hypothetical protein